MHQSLGLVEAVTAAEHLVLETLVAYQVIQTVVVLRLGLQLTRFVKPRRQRWSSKWQLLSVLATVG